MTNELSILVNGAKAKLTEALTTFPIEMEIPSTPVVIELGIEQDDIEMLGRVNIIKIGEGGTIWDDMGHQFSIAGKQPIHSIESLITLYEVVVAEGSKKLKEYGSDN